MKKAKLNSGEIIELKKDCKCPDDVHLGPHILYLDKERAAQNLLKLDLATEVNGYPNKYRNLIRARTLFLDYSRNEELRLSDKINWMSLSNIDEILDV